MKRWEIKGVESTEVEEALGGGWEPFAVTTRVGRIRIGPSDSAPITIFDVWLRRKVERKESS